MSHIVTLTSVEFKDLAALKRAVAKLGWTWQEEQTTFKWFGKWLGDTTPPLGLLTAEQQEAFEVLDDKGKEAMLTEFFGHCDHAITVPDCSYEIGIRQDKATGKYWPLWDEFCVGRLDRVINEELGNPLAEAYSVEKIKSDAEREGWTWAEYRLPSGKTQVEVTTW